MSGKKLNKVENYAANVLAGYMRSKIDANVLQPAIFSDLYGKKINVPHKAATTIQSAYRNKKAIDKYGELYIKRWEEKAQQDPGIRRIVERNKKRREAATTIQSAIRNKQARNEMAKMKEQQIMKGFKKPNLPTSVVVEENFQKPYDDISDQELVRLKFTLPVGGYKASWTRDQKDIYNAVSRRKFKVSFRKANDEYKKTK
jgi:hypothetical protein